MTTPWRIRDRATFAELRRSGRRTRSGLLTLTWLPGSDTGPPRVAYAVGRSVGPAVVRNRVRRRLRAAMAEIAGALPPGAYLIGAGPAAARSSHRELCASLAAALDALQPGSGQPRPGQPGPGQPRPGQPGRGRPVASSP